MDRRIKKLLFLAIVTALLVAVASYARNTLEIEMSPEALRNWVSDAGAAAPIAAILLVAFRSFVGIPSHLALVAVGLCFGTILGAVYGAIGLAITGSSAFLIARYGGREFVEANTPDRIAKVMQNAGDRGGVAVVGFLTAYPLGPLTPAHTFAGVTAMPFTLFFTVVSIGSIVRAACYSYFGSNLVAGGVQPILEATAVMVAVLCLPLLSPKIRVWLKHWVRAGEK